MAASDHDQPTGGGSGKRSGPDSRDTSSGDERDELLRLASVVAHQLKSPLSAVQTVLGSVLGGFAGPLDSRQRWLLQKAWQRCSTGMTVVRDLIRLRAAGSVDEGSLGPVNLAAVFTAAVDAIRDAADERQLELKTAIRVPDPAAAWIRGDAGLVREILSVLLENAVKYTPSGGRIVARLYSMAGEEGEDSRLFVEVVDTGIGIPPDGYGRLFHEFYRAPNAKKLAADGTGLGLAFAWRAARRLGGGVHLEPADTGGVRALAFFVHRPEYAGSEAEVSSRDDGALREREISQRVVIVGGVTAGSKAAARIMRLDPLADVTIVERGQFLAYAGCGLPYYISGVVSEQRALLETPLGALRDPAFFHQLKNVRALDLTEAVAIDRGQRTLKVRGLLDGGERDLPYDRLILATGARPVIPDLPGVDLERIHTLHGVEDAESIRSQLSRPRAKDVVIVGGGLLGCQITESISVRGARITLLEERPTILGMLDEELAALTRRHLEAHGVRVITSVRPAAFEGDERVRAVRLEDGTRLNCDFAILTAGRRPNVSLAREAGLEIGESGAIRVDASLRTSDPDIFAAGDCAEQIHRITGAPVWMPGAVSASIQGRVAADNVCGHDDAFLGTTGTTIVKLFDWTAARTGLSETEAREAGFDPVSVLVPGPDRVHYLPSARHVVLKLVADRTNGRLLGAQGLGEGEVAKRIDVVATALAADKDVSWLTHLHLAYAPPYSMAMDNVITAANVLRNKIEGRFRGISPMDLQQRLLSENPPFLLDVRQPSEYGRVRLRNCRHLPLGSLRGRLDEVPRDSTVVAICSIGLRSYEASLILTAEGYEDVFVLDGGLEAWPYALETME